MNNTDATDATDVRRSRSGALLSLASAAFVPRRIAVFRALFLGDLLCSIPALRALRRRFPAAEITLIGLPWARELVQRLPYIDRFESFPGYPGITEVPYDAARTEAFLAASQTYGYDLAIQLHGDGNVSNGFVADLQASISLGYRRGVDDRLSVSLPFDAEEHEVRRWLRLIGLLGAATDDQRLECPTTSDEQDRARALLAQLPAMDGPLIALHTGAKDPARRWPAERFAALGDMLAQQFGARLVLTGGDGERATTEAVRNVMHYPALDLAGATDLGTFAAVLQQLDLLVTNDTGASHLAAATATRSVVLFGPTRPECWAPLDRARHVVVDALQLAGATADPSTALQHLPLDPVFAACAALLAAPPHQQGNDANAQAIEIGAGA